MQSGKNVVGRLGLCLTLALSLTSSSYGKEALPAEVVALLPANANIVVSANMMELNKSPMYKNIKARMEEKSNADAEAATNAARFLELNRIFEEVAGLKEEDFRQMTFAADIRAVNEFSERRLPAEADMLIITSLGKPLSFATLSAVAEQLAKSSVMNKEMTISSTNYAGTSILIFSVAADEDKDEKLAMTMLGNDRLLTIGSQRTISAAIDRQNKHKTAALAQDVRALQQSVANSQFHILFALTDAMKAQLKERVATAAATPQQGMAGQILQPLQSLQSLTIATKFDDKMTLTLAVNLAEPAATQQLQVVMENMVINMVKMMLTMRTGGQPLEMLNTLKAEVAPGNVVKVSSTISANDLVLLENIRNQQ